MKQFKTPELGENIESATIIKILVKSGDIVEIDQTVLEVETDKATIEVPSDVSGKVTELHVNEGDEVEIGQAIFSLEDAAVKENSNSSEENIKEVEKDLSVTEKNRGEEIVELSDSSENKEVTINTSISKPSSSSSKRLLQIEDQPPILANSAPAAPSVRRLAREIGVDINDVKGTGLGGRILLDDVKGHSKILHQQGTNSQQLSAGQYQQPLPDFTKYGEFTTEVMSNIRYKTAEHLSYAWQAIPHVTQFDKADITQLEEFRKSYTKSVEKFGVKLTVTAILVKVIASALKKFPQFNSSVDMPNKSIIYKNYYNIGIAVDTSHGLLVPVVKNVDRLNIIEISQEINELAEKARARKLSLEDMQGGNFTISNLGGIGGTSFTPIVNSPEVAILGVSRGGMEPVYIDGSFEPRMILPLSLSYDHRVIDGADGIRFLRWVVEALENPIKLIVEG